jgi:hypothetical protein
MDAAHSRSITALVSGDRRLQPTPRTERTKPCKGDDFSVLTCDAAVEILCEASQAGGTYDDGLSRTPEDRTTFIGF